MQWASVALVFRVLRRMWVFERLAAGPEPPGNPAACVSLSSSAPRTAPARVANFKQRRSSPPLLPSCSASGFRLLKKKKKQTAAAQGYTLGLHDLLIARQRWKLREACTGKRCFVGCMCVLVGFGQLLPAGDLSHFIQVRSSFFLNFLIFFLNVIIILTKSSQLHIFQSAVIFLQPPNVERWKNEFVRNWVLFMAPPLLFVCFCFFFRVKSRILFYFIFLLNHHVCGCLLAAQPSTCARLLTNY